jgi:FkbM family methyltransferase
MAVDFSRIGRGSIAGRLGRAALGLVPKRAVVSVLQGELKGCKWVVGSSLHGCWLGSADMEKQALYREHIKPGSVVYDIGANVGYYTLLASRRAGANGWVYAFEPLPRNLAFLRRHVELNFARGGRCTGNVTVLEVAVSDAEGTATFVPDASPDRAHLVGTGDKHADRAADARRATTDGITVRTVQIDALVAGKNEPQIRPPGAIKIDVEGAEMMVLRGASETITKNRPVIILATHGPELHASCCELLRGWGYTLSPVGSKDLATADELLAIP